MLSGSPGFGVWDSPIHHGPLRLRGRSTMVRPLREILGPVGPWEAVGKVVPGCAVLELVGDPHHREMVSGGVGVGGRCFLRSPLTFVVRLVSRGVPRGVLTSGWPTHGVFVSRVVTQNSTTTYYLALGTSW